MALVASEQITLQARLAGAKIDDKPSRRRSSTKDEYGEILERRRRMKELDAEFSKDISKFLNKPL